MQNENGGLTNGNKKVARLKRATLWFFFIVGLLLCVVSLGAELLGLEFTPGFGAIQMMQLIVGITLLTGVGFLYLHSRQPPDAPRSLQADIGVRLAAMGLVFIYVCGLADLIGIGTHVDPQFERPFVGPLQLGGIFLGAISILIGLALYHGSRRLGGTSSMEFLITNGQKETQNPAHN